MSHYTKTQHEPNAWFEVIGPGLQTPRRYPTEQIANEAISLFEAIYTAGYKQHAQDRFNAIDHPSNR